VSLRGEPVTVPVEGPRVVLCTAGVVEVSVAAGAVQVRPGRAAYIGPTAGPLVVDGDGTAFVAAPGSGATA
jgi:mannose-6-phosphate isomerase